MGLDFDLLKRLSEAPGVSSREELVRAVVLDAIRPIVDEIRVDALGNAVCIKHGHGRDGHAQDGRRSRVMIAAHMDEIGFLVRYVDTRGFLRLQAVGGFDPRTLVAQRVVVHARDGERYRGVLMPSGTRPPHVQAGTEPKQPKVEDFFVDIGLPRRRVQETIEVGDMVTLDRTLERAGDMIIGKAMDDRAGVFVMIEALRAMRDVEVDVIAVATVQEEVGLRGAITAAYGIEPDVGIAIDGTLAMDVPGIDKQEMISRLGKGAAIKVMDSSSISDPRLVRCFRSVAAREDIRTQLEVLPRGGTDAGALQRSRVGVPCLTISVPMRYVHTPNEMVHTGDLEAATMLLARGLESIHTLDLSQTSHTAVQLLQDRGPAAEATGLHS